MKIFSVGKKILTKPFARVIKLIPLCALVMTLLVAFPTAASACNCSAHFEARSSSGNFKPDIPEQHFSAHHVRGNGQNNNQCRRDAREDAQSCMSAIWRNRWSPGSIPSECSGTLSSGGQRFRGRAISF